MENREGYVQIMIGFFALLILLIDILFDLGILDFTVRSVDALCGYAMGGKM